MIKLKRIKLKNYKVHQDFETEFDSRFYELKKPNEYGKSTIFEAVCDAFSFSVDKIKEKRTKGSKKLPVIILDFELDDEVYTLTLNAQSDSILLENRSGTYRQNQRSISDFFEKRGYKMLPFVVSQLLLIREKDIYLNTNNPDLKKFTGDIFNIENINTLLKIVTGNFLSTRKPGLKADGFGNLLEETLEDISTLKDEIAGLEDRVKEYEKARAEYEAVTQKKEELEKEIQKGEELLKSLQILQKLKKKEELNNEKSGFENDLKKAEEDYKKLLKTKKELTENLEKLQDTQKALKEEIEKNLKLSSEITDLLHKAEKIKEKIKEAGKKQKELEKLNVRATLIKKEIDNLSNEIATLQAKDSTISDILKIYEEIKDMENSLEKIREKKYKLEEINHNLTTLSKEEHKLLRILEDTKKEIDTLQKELKAFEENKNPEIIKERLLKTEEELSEIYSTLKKVEKIQEEVNNIKKSTHSWEPFTEEELHDALSRWQSLLDLKSSSSGEISIIKGSAVIDGTEKHEGENHLFSGKAVIEKEDLILKVYTSHSLKKKEEELAKYIRYFETIENLKNTVENIQKIKEKEIRIASFEPDKLKVRYEELEKEQKELKKKLKELEENRKKYEKLKEKLDNLEEKYRGHESSLNKIKGTIEAVKRQKEEEQKELDRLDMEKQKKLLNEKEKMIKAKLKEIGYEEPLASEEIQELKTKNIAELTNKKEEIASKKTELHNIKERITEIDEELKALSPDKLKEDLKETEEHANSLKKELTDKSELESKLKSVETEINGIRKEIEKLSKKEGLLEATVQTAKKRIKELEDNLNTIDVREESLDSIPFGVIKKYLNMRAEKLASEIQNADETLKSLRKKLTEISERAGILKTKLEYVPDLHALEEKRIKLLELERKLDRLERVKNVLMYSKDVLSTLRENIEKEYLAKMEKETGRILSEITDGRYRITNFISDTLFVNPKKKDSFEKRWQVEDTDGNVFAFDELSDGTKTQLLLSIRLALISLFFGKNTAFLMLDEPFAYFDRKREENTRKILQRLSEMNWQVLIVSAKT